MKRLTAEQYRTLMEQGRATETALAEGREPPEHRPVVKLFTPDAGCTWLLSEIDPDDPDIAFGLCDLGFGSPEIGSVRLSEIMNLRGPAGLPVERDLHFRPDRSLLAYASQARAKGRIDA